MTTRNSILLVDADTKSLRVLEVSLRKVGFDVRTAETAASALQSALTSPPDLVITDTRLPDYDGFELGRRIHRDPRTAHAILVFLSEDSTPELKVQGIDVGADEFLTKPVLVKEVVSRIRSLLERRSSGSVGSGAASLSGTLSNMGVVDLLQVMSAGSKSGGARIVSDPVRSGGFVEGEREEGVIFFRDGHAVDAQLGRLRGPEAIYRLLLWEDGVFEVQFGEVQRQDAIRMDTQDLLLEGLQRVDLWSQSLLSLPALQSRLRVDLEILGRNRPPPPREVQDLITRFDGRRNLFEVIAGSNMEDTQALRIIAAVHEQGALLEADESTSDVEALEAWLSSAERMPSSLPSALQEAMIPSPNTPSEILSAQEPRPSRVSLNRSTVPASYVGPLPSRLPEAETDPDPTMTSMTHPNLQVHRETAPPAPPERPAPWNRPPAPTTPWASGVTSPGYASEVPGWPTAAPPAAASNVPEPPPAAFPSAAPQPPQSSIETWDLGPRTTRRGGAAAAPPPAAAAAAAAAGTGYAVPAGGEAASPWSEPTSPSPESTSIQAQATQLSKTPPNYQPSVTSTFKDDFFKEVSGSGLSPWAALGFFAIIVVTVLVLLAPYIAGNRPADDGGSTEAPSEPSAQELAAAAVAEPEVATPTVAEGRPDAGPVDAAAPVALDEEEPETTEPTGARRSMRRRRRAPEEDPLAAPPPGRAQPGRGGKPGGRA